MNTPFANIVVETFLKGGPIMWPILGCLVLALATVVERCLYWRQVRRLRNEQAFANALEAIRHGKFSVAWERAQAACSPYLLMLRAGLANGRHEPVTAMQLQAEESLEAAGTRQWLLSTIITLAPLLGLLGTVIGIMGSFQFIGSEQLSVSKVSGGVGEALIATAAGLGIAIVCLIPHNFFHRCVQALRHDLEQGVNQAELAFKAAAAAGHPISAFQPDPAAIGAPR